MRPRSRAVVFGDLGISGPAGRPCVTTGVLNVRRKCSMKRTFLTIGALAALSLSVGLTGAVAANHSAGRAATVAVSGSELGRVLVDGRGRTLYLFERDKHGKSACAGPCATAWPPLIAFGTPHASAGA